MTICSILAEKERIVFRLCGTAGAITLTERAPLAGAEGRVLSIHSLQAEGCSAAIPRFDGRHDRLYSEFTLTSGGEILSGPRFVTDFAEDVPENTDPYPQPDCIKALYGTDEDIRDLGLHQTPCNINLPAIMTTQPKPDDIAYEHDGRTYYFIREKIEQFDSIISRAARNGCLITMILLNSPRLFESAGEKALLDHCLHPGYDWNSPDAYISAFNMRTEEGQGFYRAFVEFLAERYTRPDKKYGQAAGAIISNEIDSQYVWGNAGEMSVEDYTKEYLCAMRQAWLCGKKHCAHFRVYVSLDQHWNGSVHNPRYPLRYYQGRKVVECLASHEKETGEFPWHMAYHPYPEDLRWPDFWHDRSPDFTFSTPKITFKNMEVLEAYLSQEHLLYRGQPRRIIFSEQGFNSQNGSMQALTEKMAAAGYVLAYMKARNMKTLDMFMHHSYVDNPHEFGLNLGVRRYDPDAPRHAGERKPIWYAIADMDTDREPERIAQARAFIGDVLFDYLLNPPVQYADRDRSKDGEFGA